MTAPLTFSLADYDHRRACAAVLKHTLPLHLRMAWPAFLAVVALTFLTANILIYLGIRPPMSAVWGVLIAAWVFGVVASVAKRRRMWQAVQTSPLRRGPVSVNWDDEGLTVENPLSRAVYRWPAITGVIETPNGLLVMTGGMDYIPLPATAFANEAGKQATLATLRARIGAAA